MHFSVLSGVPTRLQYYFPCWQPAPNMQVADILLAGMHDIATQFVLARIVHALILRVYCRWRILLRAEKASE